jgi:hypothetical protein
VKNSAASIVNQPTVHQPSNCLPVEVCYSTRKTKRRTRKRESIEDDVIKKKNDNDEKRLREEKKMNEKEKSSREIFSFHLTSARLT